MDCKLKSMCQVAKPTCRDHIANAKNCFIKADDKCQTASVFPSNSSDLLNAIAFFENMREKQTEWYMSNKRVSLAMMAEYDSFLGKCKWAIDCLKRGT